MKEFSKKIAIIGCGNLGRSIANGLISSGYPPSQLTLTRRNVNRLHDFKKQGIQVTPDNHAAIHSSDIILLGLKPYNVEEILQDVRSSLTENHIVVSLATGITLQQLTASINKSVAVYRAMPNTAADVGESLTCICSDSDKGKNEVEEIFNSIGETVIIDEQLMEAATVLGACGIAFVLRFIRAMIQGGIQIGFDANTANIIVNQTVKGASELLIERENHPEFEIDKVTTPKGCTIEGLNEMEHHGFSSALIKGIISSYKLIEK